MSGFATALALLLSSFLEFIFDHGVCLVHLEERWLRQNIEKFFTLDRRRRLLHSSRVKLSLVSKSASLFLVSTYLIWILGSIWFASNNQSYATLWVLDTCVIIATSSLDDNLDHCLVIFKNVQLRFTLREICICRQMIEIWQLFDILIATSLCQPDVCNAQAVSCCLFEFASVSRQLLPGYDFLLFDECVTFITTFRQINSRNAVHLQTSTQRNNVRFCGTVWHWPFLLAHPTFGNKWSTSKDILDPPWCWFLIFKVRQQNLSLGKKPMDNAEPCYTHDNLPIVICVMNIVKSNPAKRL